MCAMPVFATENMGSQEVKGQLAGDKLIGSWGTHVLYNVTERYTWTVPITIDFGEDAGVNKTSTVEAKLEGSETGKKAEKDSTGAWNGTAPKVCVTENVIGVGKKLQITVDTAKHFATSFDPNDGFYVETLDTHEKLYFTITKPVEGSTALTKLGTKDNKVLSVPSGTNTAEQELIFTLTTTDKTAEKAGSYEGYVFFSSSIVDA